MKPAYSSTSTEMQPKIKLVNALSYREMLHQTESYPSSSTISRVREEFRSHQLKAYEPKIMGLGIYHHEHTPYSSKMGVEKVKALCTLGERLKDLTVDNLVGEIQKLHLQIRNCYSDSTDSLPEEILAWNFAFDACFILEFFRLKYSTLDKTVEMEIMMDIFKLENQIPLFVLRMILELEFQTPEKAISKLAAMMCMSPQFAVLPFTVNPKELKILHAEIEANIKEDPCHLLHLLSKTIEAFLRPSKTPTVDTDVDFINEWTDFIFARDVDIAKKFLVRLKPSRDGQVRFKKGWFGSAVLYLPQIYIFKETETLFWNLIAFAFESESNIIGNFIYFMKCIIDDLNSVALLRKKQIIMSERERSDKELETMFSPLSNISSFENGRCGPFENVLTQVRGHCSSSINKWMLRFTRLLFQIALIGFTLLFLSFLSTVSGFVIRYLSSDISPPIIFVCYVILGVRGIAAFP